MFEHQKRNKAMAYALVMMLALCSASVIMSDLDAASNNNETYTINMRVGDTFSYTPRVNLSPDEGSSVAIGVDMAGSTTGMAKCFDVNNGVFTFTPEDASSKTVKFKAIWVKGSLTQYAYQTINFQVYSNIEVTGGLSQSASTMVKTTAGAILYTPTISGGIAPYSMSAEIPQAISSFIGWDSENNCLKVTGTVPSSSSSDTPYAIKITVSDTGIPAGSDGKSNALDASTKIISLSLRISEGYAIIAPSYFETFAGDLNEGETRNNTFAVATNASLSGDHTEDELINDLLQETFSVSTVDGNNNAVEGFAKIAYGKVTIDPSKAGFNGTEAGKNAVKNFVVTINARGISESLGELTATHNVNVRVYADLKFISEPVISGSVASPTANSTMDMLMTATFENATHIKYVWGDGTETNVTTSGTESSKYSARHVYESEGIYFITVYAQNDKGTAKLITMYNATNGESEVVDTEPEKGFFEEHGWQFILFGILTGVLLVLFFVVGIQHPLVIIGTFVMITLCGLTFIYHDISGIIDAVKELWS